ncbi:hypothetical protein PSP20601_05037 [Pandoraea sputorum]|nr:hypothetical protein PSP20601_05037 [Pandoraea sputorum]
MAHGPARAAAHTQRRAGRINEPAGLRKQEAGGRDEQDEGVRHRGAKALGQSVALTGTRILTPDPAQRLRTRHRCLGQQCRTTRGAQRPEREKTARPAAPRAVVVTFFGIDIHPKVACLTVERQGPGRTPVRPIRLTPALSGVHPILALPTLTRMTARSPATRVSPRHVVRWPFPSSSARPRQRCLPRERDTAPPRRDLLSLRQPTMSTDRSTSEVQSCGT